MLKITQFNIEVFFLDFSNLNKSCSNADKTLDIFPSQHWKNKIAYLIHKKNKRLFGKKFF